MKYRIRQQVRGTSKWNTWCDEACKREYKKYKTDKIDDDLTADEVHRLYELQLNEYIPVSVCPTTNVAVTQKLAEYESRTIHNLVTRS